MPLGCAFHPRCSHAWDDCGRLLPPFAPLGEGHEAACLRHSIVAA
jgi:ABC-type dipeptide/oligopeptide/nickel transport system ATPase component